MFETKLPLFKLEEYFAQHEFEARYLLCCSDTESLSQQQLLAMADADSLSRWENLSLGYTETRGHPLLLEEIQKLHTRPQHLLTFAGASEGIFCTLSTLLSPGDHVVTLTPGYQSLQSLPETLGAEVTTVALRPEENWELDLNRLEEALRPDTRALVLNYPYHPAGALLSREQLDAIVEMARARGAYLFCDEVYRYLEYTEADRLPWIADTYERGISLHVLSKAWGLPGIRIGWIATQDAQLLDAIAKTKHYTTICNSAPSEILALMGLRAADQILKRSREITLSNLELLHTFMQSSDTLRWVPPKAGATAMIEVLDEPVEKLAERLLREHSLLILPRSVYTLEANFFRIGFGRSNFPEALEIFAKSRQARTQ